MKAHDRSPVATPVLVGFSLLLIGVAQITVLWTLTKAILPTVMGSPTVEDIQPDKFSPQIH